MKSLFIAAIIIVSQGIQAQALDPNDIDIKPIYKTFYAFEQPDGNIVDRNFPRTKSEMTSRNHLTRTINELSAVYTGYVVADAELVYECKFVDLPNPDKQLWDGPIYHVYTDSKRVTNTLDFNSALKNLTRRIHNSRVVQVGKIKQNGDDYYRCGAPVAEPVTEEPAAEPVAGYRWGGGYKWRLIGEIDNSTKVAAYKWGWKRT